MKIPKLYTSAIRQPDGSWSRDGVPTTLREAKKSAQFNRIIGGIQTQIVPASAEEIEVWKEENDFEP
jgi:hypothetical protein